MKRTNRRRTPAGNDDAHRIEGQTPVPDGDRTVREPAGRDRDTDRDDSSTSSTGRRPSSRGTSLKDRLRETLDKGREQIAKRTTKRTTTRARKSTAPESVVHIEYSPRMDGDPDPGEVVWAWVPFEEDPEQGKDRPVVVIGRRGSMLTGVPLTSRRNQHEAQVSIGTGAWDPQQRPSYARIWRMLDLDPNGMRREGSVLGRDKFDLVVDAVDEYYDVAHPL